MLYLRYSGSAFCWAGIHGWSSRARSLKSGIQTLVPCPSCRQGRQTCSQISFIALFCLDSSSNSMKFELEIQWCWIPHLEYSEPLLRANTQAHKNNLSIIGKMFLQGMKFLEFYTKQGESQVQCHIPALNCCIMPPVLSLYHGLPWVNAEQSGWTRATEWRGMGGEMSPSS